MLEFFIYYLFFAIIVAVIIGFVVLNLRAPSLRTMLVVIFVVLFLPLLGGYIYMMYLAPLPEAAVPDLVGVEFEEGLSRLEEVDLRGRLGGRVFERYVPEGRVVSQRPEAGRVVKKGRTVNLIVSSGSRKIIVPNLLNRPFVQVNAVLAAEGLELGYVSYEKISGYQSDIILAQEPLPGEEIDTGTKVNLVVSSAEGVYVEERIYHEEKRREVVREKAGQIEKYVPPEKEKEEKPWWWVF